MNRANALAQQGHYEEARTEYRLAQELHHIKPSGVIENRLGVTYGNQGRHHEAVVHFSNAINVKDSGTDRFNRAFSRLHLGLWHEASTDAQAALRMDAGTDGDFHSHAMAHYVLALASMATGDLTKADEHARQSVQVMEDNGVGADYRFDAYMLWAGAKFRLGEHHHAIKHYTNAIALADNAEARSSRAKTYFEAHRCDLATADAHTSVSMEKIAWQGYDSDAEANFILGLCAHEAGDFDDAIHYYPLAVALMQAAGYPEEEVDPVSDLLSLAMQRKSW